MHHRAAAAPPPRLPPPPPESASPFVNIIFLLNRRLSFPFSSSSLSLSLPYFFPFSLSISTTNSSLSPIFLLSLSFRYSSPAIHPLPEILLGPLLLLLLHRFPCATRARWRLINAQVKSLRLPLASARSASVRLWRWGSAWPQCCQKAAPGLWTLRVSVFVSLYLSALLCLCWMIITVVYSYPNLFTSLCLSLVRSPAPILSLSSSLSGSIR